MVAPPPPLFVYADFEAMQNAEGVFVANLLCYSTSEETTIHVLDGEDCALQFLRDLDDLTDVPDCEGEREILVVFQPRPQGAFPWLWGRGGKRPWHRPVDPSF